MHVLLAEREPEPRVDQRGVVRRHEHVVDVAPGHHPRRGGVTVEVADHLGVQPGLQGLPGALDPDVGAPGRAGLGPAQEVPHEVVTDHGHRAGHAVRHRGGNLASGDVGILEAGREQRLVAALLGMPGRQQPAGRGHVVGLEGSDGGGHGRRR